MSLRGCRSSRAQLSDGWCRQCKKVTKSPGCAAQAEDTARGTSCSLGQTPSVKAYSGLMAVQDETLLPALKSPSPSGRWVPGLPLPSAAPRRDAGFALGGHVGHGAHGWGTAAMSWRRWVTGREEEPAQPKAPSGSSAKDAQGCGAQEPRGAGTHVAHTWASSLLPKHEAPCGCGTHLTAAGKGPCPTALSGSARCRCGHTELVPMAREPPACHSITGSHGWLRRCCSRCSRVLPPALSWASSHQERWIRAAPAPPKSAPKSTQPLV